MRPLSLAFALTIALLFPRASAHAQAPASTSEVAVEADAYGPPLTRAERRAMEAVPAHDETNWALVGPGLGAGLGGYVLGYLTTLGWALGATGCTTRPATLADPDGNVCPRGPHSEALWRMAIPLAGPWLSLDAFDGTDVIFPVIVGILQPLGLGLLIAGFAMPNHVEARPATVQVRVGLSSLQLDMQF